MRLLPSALTGILVAVVLLAGCAPEAGDDTAVRSTGQGTLYVTNAAVAAGTSDVISTSDTGESTEPLLSAVQPPPTISSVHVTFGSVEVHRAGGGWTTLADSAGDAELTALTDVGAKVGLADLPEGHYTQLRLIITGATAVIDGETVTLTVPSGRLYLVAEFDIAAGIETTLTLTFDARRSVVIAGGSGKVLLKPVLKLDVGMTAEPQPQYTIQSPAVNGGEPLEVAPLSRAESAEDFYGYVGPDALGLEDEGLTAPDVSKLFLYENTNDGSLHAMFVHNVLDLSRSGVAAQLALNLILNGLDDLAGLATATVSDDNMELSVARTGAEGDWRWSPAHTDGGVLSLGAGAGTTWALTAEVQSGFTGFSAWVFRDASGTEHDLGLAAGATVTVEKHW